jgi:hypothetical protein
VAVAYAVLRHRVFDVRMVIRRGLQYLFARRALQALVAVPAIAFAVTFDRLGARRRPSFRAPRAAPIVNMIYNRS